MGLRNLELSSSAKTRIRVLEDKAKVHIGEMEWLDRTLPTVIPMVEQNRQIDVALRALLEMERIQPRNTIVSRNIARAYTLKGDFTRAETYFKKTLNEHPYDFNAISDWGLLHVERKEWAEAEEAFREVIKLDPYSPIGWNNLKVLLEDRKRVGDLETLAYERRPFAKEWAARSSHPVLQ